MRVTERVRAAAALRRSAVRQAVLVFSAVATVLAVLLGLAMAQVVRHGDRERALARAAELATTLANDVVGNAFSANDPRRVQLLDQLLLSRVQDGSVVRIKIWTPQGDVLWADDHRLIGKRYELEAEDEALIGTRQSSASLTDLQKPENALEQELPGTFIEVYAGFLDRDGAPLLFEAYLPADELGGGLFRGEVVALALVWLVVLMAVMLPLAATLARGLDRAQADRQRLMVHALRASELERKRLAQDLHDGVIQDLAGLGYVLSALEMQLADRPAALSTAARASDIVRRDVSALRTLSTDLYPPDLGGEGLESALEEMLDGCEDAGLTTSLTVPDRLDLSPSTALLAYRVVREALRNVVKHAEADQVEVSVERTGPAVRVLVRDDGRGFDVGGRAPEGHLGLQVLRDSITDAGGQVELRSSGSGTVLEAQLPVR